MISNSIVHHIPEPATVLAEMVRVTAPGGVLFVRDLLRPDDEATLRRLVELHAAGANAHQQQMFADSLHAALTLAEVRDLVATLGFDPVEVRQTTDRHWTWNTRSRDRKGAEAGSGDLPRSLTVAALMLVRSKPWAVSVTSPCGRWGRCRTA